MSVRQSIWFGTSKNSILGKLCIQQIWSNNESCDFVRLLFYDFIKTRCILKPHNNCTTTHHKATVTICTTTTPPSQNGNRHHNYLAAVTP
uniref:Uncharacterized protein n=1 Tax=Helianthus annuus TaxID=4232 RepID=A0A251T0V8_HELAN